MYHNEYVSFDIASLGTPPAYHMASNDARLMFKYIGILMHLDLPPFVDRRMYVSDQRARVFFF